MDKEKYFLAKQKFKFLESQINVLEVSFKKSHLKFMYLDYYY